MSVFYEMYGTVEVKDCPEVNAIVDRFNKEGGGDLYIETIEGETEGTVTLQFAGGINCAYSTVEDIDDIVMGLSNFITAPSLVSFDCDGENGQLHLINLLDHVRQLTKDDPYAVGVKRSEVSGHTSATARDEIQNLLEFLNEKDKGIIREWLS